MIVSGREVSVEEVLDELGIEPGIESNGNCVTRCPWPDNHSGEMRTLVLA